MCEVKSLPALYKTRNSSVIALCRRDQEALRSFQERHHLESATLHSSPEDLIARLLQFKADHPLKQVGVYISTPVSTHAPLAKLSIAAGLITYLEKPAARSAAESLEVLEVLKNAPSPPPVFVAYYRRCLPKFVAVKQALAALGTVSSVSVTLFQKRHLMDPAGKGHWHFAKETSGGGLLLDLGSHTMDLLDFLLGPIRGASGVAARVNAGSPGGEDVEDVVVGSWLHAGGGGGVVPGSATFNFAASHDLDQTVIVGSKGTVRFGVFDNIPATLTTAEGAVWTQERSLGFKHLGGVPEHVQGPLVEKIVGVLVEGKERGEDVSTLESAQRTGEVLDKLLNGRGGWEEDYVLPKAE